jgi:hypothetical protein
LLRDLRDYPVRVYTVREGDDAGERCGDAFGHYAHTFRANADGSCGLSGVNSQEQVHYLLDPGCVGVDFDARHELS